MPNRDELWSQYLDQLPYEPYPVQERALLEWFESDEGVLVCAPTGTGNLFRFFGTAIRRL